jgi:hypothetical protein
MVERDESGNVGFKLIGSDALVHGMSRRPK